MHLPKVADNMGHTQLRRLKLCFAGRLGNGEFANYDVEQTSDGFDIAANPYPMLGRVPFAKPLKDESGFGLRM
jgi:hypothetical protein